MSTDRNEELLQVMGRHPFTDSFDADQEARLVNICSLVHFEPGEYLLREDQICDSFYLLIRGLVSIELQLRGGKLLRVQTEGPGSEIGWSWLFPPYRGNFDVRALERCKAVAVDAQGMRRMMEEDTCFGFRASQELLKILISRLSQSRLQLVDIHSTLGER